MNRKKERFVETFVTVMFPVALLVACTTNGNDTTVSKQDTPVGINQPTSSVDTIATSALPFGSALSKQSSDTEEELTWSIDQQDEQYVMVSPSLHLAIYKPSQPSADDMDDNEPVQMVKLNEPNELKKLEKYTFRFDSDNYNIAKEDLAELKAHAQFLIDHPNFTLTVSGHTDHTGSKAHNQKLSEQRAQFVADILVTYGVPKSQLIVDGYGETVPVSDKLEENRRVELEYSQALLLSSM